MLLIDTMTQDEKINKKPKNNYLEPFAGLLCNAEGGKKSIPNYGNVFCQPALLERCQGNSLIIKDHGSVNVISVGLLREWLLSFQEKGAAE